jgi:hypothetical protein
MRGDRFDIGRPISSKIATGDADSRFGPIRCHVSAPAIHVDGASPLIVTGDIRRPVGTAAARFTLAGRRRRLAGVTIRWRGSPAATSDNT